MSLSRPQRLLLYLRYVKELFYMSDIDGIPVHINNKFVWGKLVYICYIYDL